MSKVFVVQSEQGHYYSKHGEWLSGKDNSLIYFGKYRDEALNQLIDITIKDVDIRARVKETELNAKNYPVLEIVVESDLNEPEQVEENSDQSADDSFNTAASA